VIGFGTYELKGADCVLGLTHALEVGYRHIDTATIYKNEAQIAQVLRKFAKQVPREELFITSKVSPYD
jgi:2,5-diketo-D-gluconate reductase A